MRLAYARWSLAGLAWLVPSVAIAAPPPLPEGEVEPDAAAPAPTDAPKPMDDSALPPSAPDASADDAPPTEPAPDIDPSGAAALGVSGGIEADTRADDGGIVATSESDAAAAEDDSDPGMVRGRREPMMPTQRGGIGLFHTTLPDAGGKYTFRFRLHTDFFRKSNFMYPGDQQARVRGGVTLGFSPFEWGELFFSVNSSANRNARQQPGRQDAESIFALGDLDFGIKGAHRFKKNGIGLGGQVGVGLLSGSERLLTSSVNFWFDALFAVDIRYLTKKQFPFRFTTNVGWILDNSLRVANYGAITDPSSREITRFSLGGNHNRVRMRYAVDFPIRVGKERQFGIDPILEWAWDVSTTEEPAFAQPNTVDSPLPRSTQWMTVGLRANVISGLHVDAGVDVGLVSPNFEYGPQVPPWQVVLGLGWAFDPNPVVKEVEVEPEGGADPQPGLEGRIVGQVVGPDGAGVSDAKILFPGLAPSAILTDAAGNFTSYRFPAGPVTLQVLLGEQVVKEEQVQISDGQDTPLTITLDTLPATATGVVQGAFVDEAGSPVKIRMHVVGEGVDEPFDSTEGGLIALELYAGKYRATLSADGFLDKSIAFEVPAKGEIQLKETLVRDKPPETPNVSASGRSIRLRKSIRYRGNDLDPASHAILDELATFLSFHKEYESIEIGVHTDDRGAAKARSDARADAVRSYLVGKGISPDRVVAKGYGASSPVAVNLTAAGRAKNNRTAITVRKSSGSD